MIPAIFRSTSAALLAGIVLSGTASADPLLVLDGGFTYEGDPTGYRLSGEGFSIQGGGSFPIRSVGNGCGLPCPAGTSVDLSSVLGGDLIPGSLAVGSATVQGSTFENILLGGTLSFDAPTVVLPEPPALEDQPLFLTDTFMFRGRIAGFDRDTESALFRADLIGQGTVRLRTFFDTENQSYFFREVSYEFTPVPEPATIFLLGAGVAALAGRRRTSKSRRTSVRARAALTVGQAGRIPRS